MARWLVFTAAFLVGVGEIRSDVTVAAVFADHMVLQRDRANPVWGWAESGERVTVSIDGQSHTTTADDAGHWRLNLEPLGVGEPRTMTVAGKGMPRIIRDILIGDVWICGGQSNMEWPVSSSNDAARETAAANHSALRLFQVGNERTPLAAAERLLPHDHRKCVWQPCDPKSVARFSAVAYFFGRKLQEELNVPIGLIDTSVGATPIESWISRDALQADAEGRALLERWDRMTTYAASAKGKAELADVFAEYDSRQKEARAKGGWYWRSDDYQEPMQKLGYPGTFFNARIAPLAPFGMRGVIWYQGEANWARGAAYRRLFPILIRDWRRRWGQGDSPFLFVQLPNFGPAAKTPENASWAELRESQTLGLREPKTSMAVAIDLGDARDIHPKNKHDVGRRLALLALRDVYGKDLVASGPMFRDMTVEDASVRIRFDHVGGGLVAKGASGGTLTHFAIAGDDRKFVWAKATIDGASVIVRSDAVARPTAVRYAWASNPEGCNLFNRDGLPAAPFRTDTWPGATTEKTYRTELDRPLSFKLGR